MFLILKQPFKALKSFKTNIFDDFLTYRLCSIEALYYDIEGWTFRELMPLSLSRLYLFLTFYNRPPLSDR